MITSNQINWTQTILTSLAVLLALLPVVPGAVLAADTRAPAAMDQDLESPTPPGGLSAQEWRSMQEMVAEAEYQFAWQMSDGVPAYRAPNRAHDLSLSLASDGLYAARYGAGREPLWDWGLSLLNYGGQTFATGLDKAGLRGLRERVEYHWSRDVVEWYVNGTEGVEHGLTLAARPAGADDSTVELTFALRGSLSPELDGSGQVLRLKDATGETVLIYDQLAVYDATGRSLPAQMRLTRGAQSARLQLVVDTSGATYPLTVDPLLHSQAAKLTASDAANADEFGEAVAVSGDTIVVGAPSEDDVGDDRGAAYVFERNQGGADDWGQVKKLTASDAADDDFFGCAVAISGSTIVVGATAVEDGSNTDRGAVYVFERNQGGADNWGQVKRLTASDAADEDYFGRSVAISGDTIVVGAYWADGAYDNCGAVYVFERNYDPISPMTPIADNWGQVQKLFASDDAENDHFGGSVAISRDTIVVGAEDADVSAYASGSAYVFERNTGGADNWGQVTQLAASDPESGDSFGQSVAVSGDTVVVSTDRKAGNRGAAYVFERNQGGADDWGQVQKLTASDTAVDDFFGYSVAISGDTVVVGAHHRQAAYVFERNEEGADNWGETKCLTASDAEASDHFAISLAISGNTIIVGANREDGAGSDRGAAYLFVVAGGQWLEVAIPHASDPENNDEFGIAVAISGDTAIVGAHKEDGPGSNRGAAYIIERNQNGADHWGQVTKVVCFDCTDEDLFGRSVSISGDTAVVGAWEQEGGGAAYIYERNYDMYTPNTPEADVWGEVAKLTAGADADSGDYFGFSVSISGDTVIVGAWHEDGAGSDRGAAYVFERNEGGADIWGQVQELTASDDADNDFFGYAVAISGDTAIVGAWGEDGKGDPGSDRGAAYIFERNYDPITPSTPIADNWGEVQKLVASDPDDEDRFGISVAIGGDTAIVGAYWADGVRALSNDRGAAYVYERNKDGVDNWGEVQRLTASDAENDDKFGISVAISGDTVVVGAHVEDGEGSDRGATYVYERNRGGADSWDQVAKLTASYAEDNDYFGRAVAISGDTIVVGAYGEGGFLTPNHGAAYVFTLNEFRIYLPVVLKSH